MKGKIEVFHDGVSWVVRYLKTEGEWEGGGKGQPYDPVYRTQEPKAVPGLVHAVMIAGGVIKKMSEYAFEVKMNAVVRVRADSQEAAERTVRTLQAMGINKEFEPGVIVTEASVDDVSPFLFEIDGEEAERL